MRNDISENGDRIMINTSKDELKNVKSEIQDKTASVRR